MHCAGALQCTGAMHNLIIIKVKGILGAKRGTVTYGFD